MLAQRFARLSEPLRYAHTPESLASMQNYLRFASRIMGLPDQYEGTRVIGHYDNRPYAGGTMDYNEMLRGRPHQAMRSFLETGHPADLMAMLDMFHQDAELPHPDQMIHGGSTIVSPLSGLLRTLHALHQSDMRAQSNPFHVGRFMSPEFLGNAPLVHDLFHRYRWSSLNNVGRVPEEGAGILPHLHDLGQVTEHPLNDVLGLATENARRSRTGKRTHVFGL